jgi:uncharacterized protein
MRWDDQGKSQDLEDRRGESPSSMGGGLPFGGGGSGLIGLVLSLVMSRFGLGGILVLGIAMFALGINPLRLIGGGGMSAPPATQAPPSNAPVRESASEAELVRFMSFVLDDAQKTWGTVFQNEFGQAYPRAKLVLFRNRVNSGCGMAESATGPFYCPRDQKVYIDLNFYDELKRRFGAPGDFAQAYVLAHEIGHHVQTVTGTERQVRAAQQRDPETKNELSVRMELQADCYAGIWAKSTAQRGLLEAGDVEEALGAASAVGDDRISEMTGSDIRPESFTHGSAQQRMTWFKRGFDTGSMKSCDTFASR